MSRWDVAVAKDGIADELKNRLGIAIGKRAYAQLRRARRTPTAVKAIEDEGGHHQRLLWASTGTKDPDASDTLYIEAFASPDTVNTMPEKTLLAFADHGEVGDPLPEDGGDAEEVLKEFEDAGVDIDALAHRLQVEGAEAFVKSWQDVSIDSIESRRARRSVRQLGPARDRAGRNRATMQVGRSSLGGSGANSWPGRRSTDHAVAMVGERSPALVPAARAHRLGLVDQSAELLSSVRRALQVDNGRLQGARALHRRHRRASCDQVDPGRCSGMRR